MRLYRIFWSYERPALDSPGGPLFVPPQGSGRFDNPAQFGLLYLGAQPHGVIAEALGRFPRWSRDLLAPPPSVPATAKRSLARYELSEVALICDLDDPRELVSLRTKPSLVITRDYDRSRQIALDIQRSGSWSGLSWWAYYESPWTNYALWELAHLDFIDERPLSLDDPDLRTAAIALPREIAK